MPRSEKEKFVYDCIARMSKVRGTFEEKKKECEEEYKLAKQPSDMEWEELYRYEERLKKKSRK